MVLFTISKIIYKIQLIKLITRNFIELYPIQKQFKIWLKKKKKLENCPTTLNTHSGIYFDV